MGQPKPVSVVRYHNPPCNCDTCRKELRRADGTRLPFYEAYLTALGGPWGNVCEDCAKKFGVRVGQGRGQRYEWNETEHAYVKTAG